MATSDDTTLVYDAFLSYSHRSDGRLGPSLRDALHQFARPWYRKRALRVFCDQRSLSASPGVWSSIVRALDRSRHFILLASPAAASSSWVQQEVAQWQARQPRRPLLIVLTDGEIVWDPAAGDFDWSRTTALPLSLRGWFAEEPLWVDLRQFRTESELSSSNPLYLDQVVTLAAAIHNRSKDDLVGEDIRQYRRAARFRALSWTGLTVLSVLAVVAASIAFVQLSEARRLQRVATAQSLAAQAAAAHDGSALAIRMGLAAMALDPRPSSRAALVGALADGHRKGVLPGLSGPVHAISFSSDSRLLATAGVDGTAVWQVTDPAEPSRSATLDGRGAVQAVAFSPTAPVLVTAGDGPTVRWDLSDLDHPVAQDFPSRPGPVRAVAFSPDGRRLATGAADGTVTLWDVGGLAAPRPITSLTGFEQGLAFGGDGHTIAVGSGAASVIWDVSDPNLPTSQEPLQETGPVYALALTPNTRYLITGGQPSGPPTGDGAGNVYVWDASAHPREDQFTRVAGLLTATSAIDVVDAVAVSPDGHTVLAGTHDGTATMFDITNPTVIRRGATLVHTGGAVTAVAFSPDGGTAVTAGEDGRAILWDAVRPASPAPLSTVDGLVAGAAPTALAAAAVTEDGHTAITGGTDGYIVAWNTTHRDRPVRAAELGRVAGPVVAIAVSGHIALAANATTVVLWDITDPTMPIRLSSFAPGFGNLTAALFGRDGKTLYLGGSREARVWSGAQFTIWDTADAVHPHQLTTETPGPATFVSGLAMSPDGATLLVGYWNGRPQLWDVTTPTAPQRLSELESHHGTVRTVAFGPDGHTLVIGDGATMAVWDAGDPEHPTELVDVDVPGAILATAFSPDGHGVYTGGEDNVTTMWDLTDPQSPSRVVTLVGHAGTVVGIGASRDGHTVFTANADATMMLWDVAELTLIVRAPPDAACAIVGRGFTDEEWSRYVPGVAYQDTCPAHRP